MINSSQPYTFDRVIRIIFTIAAIVGIFFVLSILKGALLPFVIAWLLAYLTNPIVLFFQNRVHIKNRLLAIITTLVLIVSVLSIIGVALVPSIINEIDKTALAIQDLSKSANFGPIVEKAWYQSAIEKINMSEIGKLVNPEEWSKIVENTLSRAWAILSGSINQIISIIGWLIVLLYLVFILLDYDKIINGFSHLIPLQYRQTTLSILKDVEEGMNRYFRGQSLIALIVGILFSIGFVIIGLPMAIPLGLFIGLLNLVPYLQVVGIIPTILLCLLDAHSGTHGFWSIFGLSMLVFAVVQTIQDLYITPKIMGKATGLNPAVILLSLSVWGSLLGVMGMIIALPLTSLLLSYYHKYIIGDKVEEQTEQEPKEVE
ncbi:MAG: AI-2E family transporter [Rikenellaceae bacterium]